MVIPTDALLEFAYARRLAQAAMRQGCVSFGAILRYVQRRNPDVRALEVFGAMIVMERMEEVRVTGDRMYVGQTKETMRAKS